MRECARADPDVASGHLPAAAREPLRVRQARVRCRIGIAPNPVRRRRARMGGGAGRLPRIHAACSASAARAPEAGARRRRIAEPGSREPTAHDLLPPSTRAWPHRHGRSHTGSARTSPSGIGPPRARSSEFSRHTVWVTVSLELRAACPTTETIGRGVDPPRHWRYRGPRRVGRSRRRVSVRRLWRPRVWRGRRRGRRRTGRRRAVP